MNIAGPVKYSQRIETGYTLGKQLLQARLSAIVHFEESISATGCEGFFVVDAQAAVLKHICVMIEDSQPVCRLFDMEKVSALPRL
jgi:phosphoribosyl-dephospho-CoA transferase